MRESKMHLSMLPASTRTRRIQFRFGVEGLLPELETAFEGVSTNERSRISEIVLANISRGDRVEIDKWVASETNKRDPADVVSEHRRLLVFFAVSARARQRGVAPTVIAAEIAAAKSASLILQA